jgi:multidrug resistance efflux pump
MRFEAMRAPTAAVADIPVIREIRKNLSFGWITRISLAVALLVAGAAIYGPQLLYTTSSDAVLNARIITITSPIEGRVAGAPPAEGTVIGAETPLATVENPIVDRGRLVDLETARARAAADLSSAKHLAEALTAQISALDDQRRHYLAATVTRLSLTLKEAQADATASAATATDARHNYERKRSLQIAVTVSAADVDQARQASIRTEAIAARARFTAQRLAEELDAAKGGVLVGADRNDVPYSQQRVDEFRLRKSEAEAQVAALTAQLEQLDGQLAAERTRAASLATSTLQAPVPAVVWRSLVTSGSAVARDAEVMTLINCSQIYATATFTARHFDDLYPGRHAIVHIVGTNTDYPATVVGTRAMQAPSTEDRFAAPLPKISDGQLIAILRLDNPGSLTSTNYCNVGRRVDVRLTR